NILVMSNVELALTANHRAGFHMGGQEQLSPCVGGSACQHGIKAGAINVPAATERIVKKIAMARGSRLPRRADAVRFQFVGGEKSIPDTQLHQRPAHLWWQRLANANVLVGGLLDQRNAEPTATKIE